VRLILPYIYTMLALCLTSSVAAETDLQTCLQNHLDDVLGGAPIGEHTDIGKMTKLVLEVTDTPSSPAVRQETATFIDNLLSEKIAKSGKKYRGTKVTIVSQSSDPSSVEGRLTTPSGQKFHFVATLGSSCRIVDLRIAKIFTLSQWIQRQISVKALLQRLEQAS
jgi:hypothetical protein